MPNPEHPALKLRLDLQGLRAIAVSVVVFAHAGVAGFSGGYVGVDIFFILSGFLITGALYKEFRANGKLNILGFYSRRLKRLLPAMAFMITITLVAAFVLLPEFQAKAQIGSAPFASLWLSNFYFTFAELDYFNELGQKDLFLHTWSLGVEEQFYLLWPLLFLLLVRFEQQRLSERYDVSQRLIAGLCLVFVLSMALSLYWTEENPPLAFYQMPSRAWQFALGGLLFFMASQARRISNRRVVAFSGFLLLISGLMGISLCVYIYTDQMSYPGWAAAAPSFGAAFVILGGSLVSETSNPLSLKPLVWLGNRSYSLYLWHWPVLLLVEAVYGNVTGGLVVAVIAISLLLTEVTHRLVELPFWKGSLSHYKPKTTVQFSTLVMLLALLGSFNAARQPLVNGVDRSKYASQESRYDVPIIYRMPCDAWYEHDKVEPCVFGPKDPQKTVILLGDSIGAQWFSLVAFAYLERDWRMVVLTKSACPMVDHSYFYDRIKQVFSVCDSWRDKVLARISEWNPEVVVVGSASSYGFSDEEWISGSQRVWEKLQGDGAQIVVVPGIPALTMNAPACISREIQKGTADLAEACSSDQSGDVAYGVSRLLKTAAADMEGVDVLDLNSWVCPSRTCSAIADDGVVVYRDNKHLTNSFVSMIAPQIAPQLINFLKVASSQDL